MARYDYRCAACGNVFEVEHGMSEHPTVSCPACGHVAERVYSASGIVLSGSGFYNTDQRGSAKAADANGSASGAAKADAPKKDSGSSESSKKRSTPADGASAE